MRGQLLKSVFSSIFTVLCVVSLLSLIWYVFDNKNVEPYTSSQKRAGPQPSDTCHQTQGCQETIQKVVKIYSQTWKRQEDKFEDLRSQLNKKCQGFEKAILTQVNTPVGSKLVYDGDKRRTLTVTPEIFKLFPKEDPFPNKILDTCAVVGNGGILSNSSCGSTIDSAQFVFRCNLPPLENGYETHVGSKTDLVTANPSIFIEKYGSLVDRRRPFVESLRKYGNSLLLLPAFSYSRNTPLSMRVVYSIEELESPIQPVFFNPQYLQSLAAFWRSQGWKAVRLSSGLMLVSLALEYCNNVHLYGFWPFSNHPDDFHVLTNHYYDDRRGRPKFHAMPTEFEFLLRLHSQGVLRLHLGQCQPGQR